MPTPIYVLQVNTGDADTVLGAFSTLELAQSRVYGGRWLPEPYVPDMWMNENYSIALVPLDGGARWLGDANYNFVKAT